MSVQRKHPRAKSALSDPAPEPEPGRGFNIVSEPDPFDVTEAIRSAGSSADGIGSLEAALGATETVALGEPGPPPISVNPWLVYREEERQALEALGEPVQTPATFKPDGANVVIAHMSGDLYAVSKVPEMIAYAYRQGAATVRVVCAPGKGKRGKTLADWLKSWSIDDLHLIARKVRIEPQPTAAATGGRGGDFVEFLKNPPPVRPISVTLWAVPAMDERLIPEPFRAWLKDIAERACCPLDLPVISAMVCLGAEVGRRVAIRPKRKDDWTVVPNLWGMGVLPPGWLKTHSLEEPKKPLARLELEAREKYAQALKDFAVDEAVATAQAEAAKASLKEAAKRKKGVAPASDADLRDLAAQALAKPALVAPTLRRYIINDATVEKLGELLAENPNGLLLYRDELMGFLKSLEKQGHEGDRAFYLESWNGTGSYSYDRIGRGSLFIPSNTVSILGGIQPVKLAAYIRAAGSGENDDGLISRFQLIVYPNTDQQYKHVDEWPNTTAKNRAYDVFKKLAELDAATIGAVADQAGEIPYLRFADDAQKFFDGWLTDIETRIRSSQEAGCLIAHLAKYRSLLPSLALLFHLLEVADGTSSGPVTLTCARRAAAWCDYLEAHARRIYQAAFDGDPEPAQRLAERIKASLPNPFTLREVVRKGWKSLATYDDAERAVALAEEHGWVCPEEVPSTSVGGRPTVQFHVNPRLFGGDQE